MKITELLAPSKQEDTTSSATTSSAIHGDQTQDVVPQDIVSENTLALEVDSIEEHPDHSAIAEGVSQIFRRKKGGAPTKGFRCSSGPRKGRIVAKPSTCFAKTDPQKSAKIRKKRMAEGQGSRQEDGHDQEVRWRICQEQGHPDQESKAERTRVQGQDEGQRLLSSQG